MLSLFELRFVFGLFVLCVFDSFFVDAQLFKNVLKTSTGSARSRVYTQRQPANLPLAPRTSLRSRPAYSSQPSLTSMSEVNLRSPSLSSEINIHRSVSVPSSLNVASSPSIMREITHSQAALALNTMGFQQIHPNPASSSIHRLIPNLSNIGKYLKNGAIASAGAGGAIQIVKAMKGDECCEEKIERKEEENLRNEKPEKDPKTTTDVTSSEFYNRVGVDK